MVKKPTKVAVSLMPSETRTGPLEEMREPLPDGFFGPKIYMFGELPFPLYRIREVAARHQIDARTLEKALRGKKVRGAAASERAREAMRELHSTIATATTKKKGKV